MKLRRVAMLWRVELGAGKIGDDVGDDVKSSGDQHLAVGEQRRRRIDATNVHVASGSPSARGRPLAGGWVIEFGAGGARTTVAAPAGDQHLAVVLPPPATSTWPFSSSVAVWPVRAVVMLPVRVQVWELP
jgi:hypothetical protein